VHAGEARTGDVIAANYQSAGRGRLDRSFDAAPSTALMFSLYIESKRPQNDWSFIPLLAGIAASESINPFLSERKISLKWPNDLLIGNEKLGGIISTATSDGVIIGIGINVNATIDELPVSHATSLSLNGCTELDRNVLLCRALASFEELFNFWDEGRDLRERYIALSSTLSRSISAELPGGELLQGIAKEISPDGELILEDGRAISVGDIVHLR
jgi:BirA family biotin operon repressor/biotin-[acetyl-CoA-carboxylase] ligase